jgi:phytanoyl-CoA hydroxylase
MTSNEVAIIAPHLGEASIVSDETPRFESHEVRAAADYYAKEGYVVIRGLVPRSSVEAVNATFDQVVRPYDGYIYRQTTCDPERHRFSPEGLMLNPILNVQDLQLSKFEAFRNAGLDVLTAPSVRSFLDAVFGGDQGKLVQSMYFEGNPATWAHQDTYYLDSEHLGTMIAGWFATEDVDARAGRFFVYPKSHLVDMFRNGGNFDVAFNHDKYKRLVLETITELDLTCKAPALDAGDVLFWNSKTIHGSLETSDGRYGRRSLTAHYLPTADRFLQHQTRIRPLSMLDYNGYPVHSPKSMDKRSRRSVLAVETRFPRAFKATKKAATKALITVNGLRRRV